MDEQLPQSQELQQYQTPTPILQGHFLNKKFVITVLVLIILGGIAYGTIWYWQKQQLASEVVPTFTPRPTDDIANWKTYSNTQYGFEVKYPLTKIIVGDFNKNHSINITKPQGTDLLQIEFLNKNVDQIKNEIVSQRYLRITDESTTFNGSQARKLTYYPEIGNDPYTTILVSYNDGTFKFTHGSSPEYIKILSTFKFTK